MHMLADLVELVIGVDTHKDTHTAAVVQAVSGAVLDQVTVPATPAGYRQLLRLADRQDGRWVWAIEGTGGYGAGLTRFLAAHQEHVVELDRPKRAARRHGAKSDPLDATRAAREAPGPRPTRPAPRRRSPCGAVGAAGRPALGGPGRRRRPTPAACAGGRLARRPPQPASRLDHCTPDQHLCTAAAADRLGCRDRRHCGQPACPGPPHPAPEHRGRRPHPGHQRPGPDLAARPAHPTGVGPIVAATVLCAWSHAGRCRTDAAFAMLGGAAPIPASSGQTVRVRLNRSGDRQLNQALHLVVLTRLRYDPATRAYAQRRRAEGKTNREIRRCLVRYVARQLYRLLEANPAL
jgi:transposase